MAWKVHEIVEAIFRGKPHRFLELESDTTDELDGLVARSVEKGWAEYVTGARVGASQVQVVIMFKLRDVQTAAISPGE
jgi:hypothetical protein